MTEIDAPAPVIAAIDAGGVVAIIRGAFLNDIHTVVDALIAGGIRAIEVSLRSPRALDQIERAALHAGSRAVIGAGTVMSAGDVREVARLGASFVVAPVVDAEVVAAALDHELAAIPGAATPTECVQAVRFGAAAVKLFPAETLGPGFVRAILAPMPDLKLIPTGGVTISRAEEFAAAGAWAVGVGSPLVSSPLDAETLADRAAGFVRAMRPPAR